LTLVGVSASQPIAFPLVGNYVGSWLVLDRRSFDWQSAATVATWIMTLFSSAPSIAIGSLSTQMRRTPARRGSRAEHSDHDRCEWAGGDRGAALDRWRSREEW